MGDNFDYTPKYQQLLRDLKNTIEGLLVTQVANVWSIYGGLSRVHNTLVKIFKHGCKGSQDDQGYNNFIQGLEWLQPETSKSYFSIDCEYRPHIPTHLKDDKSSIWLYRSLENHSLSQKLSWLLSDQTHLKSCYQAYAFLLQEKYAEATLICLRAVERNQPSLMSEINPCLFLMNSREFHKVHRRCSSFPDNQLKKIYEENSFKRRKTIQTICDEIGVEKFTEKKVNIQGKLKPWNSMPSLLKRLLSEENSKVHIESKTTPTTPVHNKKIERLPAEILQVNYRSLQPKHQKDGHKKHSLNLKPRNVKRFLINNQDIIEHTPPLSSSQSSGTITNEELLLSTKSCPAGRSPSAFGLSTSPLSLVDAFLPMSGEKDYKKRPKKTFIEDGGLSVLPMATGYFPKPAKGQSLMAFLTSGEFSKTNAELDRENAHFYISEAIISAMEQIRYKRTFRIVDDQMDDSDPEIVDLKQRIRLRRTERVIEKHRKAWTDNILSDGRTDTATSASPRSTSPDTLSDGSSDLVEDIEISQASNLKDSVGLSMSMASLYSEADLKKRQRGVPDGASDIMSAEGVALSLISKFSDKQLPKASDLEWLVTEQEAPQALLPLPKSWPVSPDSAEGTPSTSLRGTQDWAPPRAQIIFTCHPVQSRKNLMAKQNYRCAGCGMRVAPKYASRFRYCEYLGRNFCTGCHTNQLALIPGKVLQKWDFTSYPVSTFSYRLLEQMYTDPLFRVIELNKNIEKLSKNFQFCRKYRMGLFYLKDFIFSCRYAELVRDMLEEENMNFLKEPEVYSMADLVSVRSGDMKNKLRSLVEMCCRHTSDCKLCLAKGFICEVCQSDEVIFPWHMSKVNRCNKCGNCYHISCWNPKENPCSKCTRLQKRRETIDINSS